MHVSPLQETSHGVLLQRKGQRLASRSDGQRRRQSICANGRGSYRGWGIPLADSSGQARNFQRLRRGHIVRIASSRGHTNLSGTVQLLTSISVSSRNVVLDFGGCQLAWVQPGNCVPQQGWRLDPLLLFGQIMTTGAAVSFAIEALRLRSEQYEGEVGDCLPGGYK